MGWMLGVLGVWMLLDEMRWVVVMRCTISLNVKSNVNWVRMNTTHGGMKTVRVERKEGQVLCKSPKSKSKSLNVKSKLV